MNLDAPKDGGLANARRCLERLEGCRVKQTRDTLDYLELHEQSKKTEAHIAASIVKQREKVARLEEQQASMEAE
jgi:hypothetical protein